VGKSSLVNMRTGRKRMAGTSKTPGKTQRITVYSVRSPDRQWALADLPGYGFAKAPKAVAEGFVARTQEYLIKRANLIRACVLVDASIPPQQADIECVNWMGANGVPVSVVFTKWDKRKKLRKGVRSRPHEHVLQFAQSLQDSWDELPPMLPASAIDARGREKLLGHIAYCRTVSEEGFRSAKRRLASSPGPAT